MMHMLLLCNLIAAAASSMESPPSPGSRLLKHSPDAAPVWTTQAQISALLERRSTEHRHGGPGFIDLTETPLSNATASQHIAVTFPTGPSHQEEVNKIIASFLEPGAEARALAFLTELTELNNRYYTGPQAAESSELIANHAQALIDNSSRTDASVVLLPNAFPQSNIVAYLEGSAPELESVVLGAHMDSIGSSFNSETARAPGADDNGSGSTAVMLAFEAILQSGFVTERTIEFHWYGGEERGLLGSRSMAADRKAEGTLPLCMCNIDMCGGSGFDFITDYVDGGLTKFEETLVDEYCEQGWRESRCGYACSDHASWYEVGVPSSHPWQEGGAIDPVTGRGCPIHSASDELKCVDFTNLIDFARLAVAYCIELNDFESK